MLKQGLFEVKENKKIAKSVYKMTLSGDASAIERPGQFINIKLDGFFSDVRFRCATAMKTI